MSVLVAHGGKFVLTGGSRCKLVANLGVNGV